MKRAISFVRQQHMMNAKQKIQVDPNDWLSRRTV